MILQHGRPKLTECAMIQIEMPFVTLYKNRPTFGDDAELRAQGFAVHGFANIKRLPMHPYTVQGPVVGMQRRHLISGDCPERHARLAAGRERIGYIHYTLYVG